MTPEQKNKLWHTEKWNSLKQNDFWANSYQNATVQTLHNIRNTFSPHCLGHSHWKVAKKQRRAYLLGNWSLHKDHRNALSISAEQTFVCSFLIPPEQSVSSWSKESRRKHMKVVAKISRYSSAKEKLMFQNSGQNTSRQFDLAFGKQKWHMQTIQ